MATLAELQVKVDQVTQVEASAVTLIDGLAAQISALVASGGSPAAFQSLAEELTASSNALAAAVTANTPAQP